MKRDPDRWLRLWLWGFNLLVLALGLVWAISNRRALFLAVFVPLALAPFSYGRVRAVQALRRNLPRRAWCARLLRGFGAAGVVCDAVMLAQLLTARSPADIPLLQTPVLSWIGPVWFSAHLLFLVGLGLTALLRTMGGVTRRLTRRPRAEVSQERRLVLRQIGVMSVGAPFAISLSGVPLSYDFRLEEREVPLPGWPRHLDGLRLAHLSDIHVGGAMNRERLQRVAELTNSAHPDIVFHTGDFLTHREGDFDAYLYEALASIRAPHGQWACLGNHDYDDPERLVRRLHDAGVRTLRNDVASIAIDGTKVEIAGLEFFWDQGARRSNYASIVGNWGPKSGPRLLLNHDPTGFSTLPENCADLVCSGHTHGGHIGIQLGRDQALTVVGLIGLPDQGFFERPGMRMFVTRCVGFYGYPMRIGIPPEIALLVLRSV